MLNIYANEPNMQTKKCKVLILGQYSFGCLHDVDIITFCKVDNNILSLNYS